MFLGPERLSRFPDGETNKVTAYHEAGHTVVSFFTKHSEPLHKVTIIPRGDALGYTASIPEKDLYNKTKMQLLAELDLCMGGRAAEEIIFGPDMVTTGASSDFSRATKIATAMVKQLGMSEKIGQRVFKDEQTDVGLATVSWNEISPGMQDMIDQEIKRILSESYERAKTILKNHINELKALAKALLDVETLDSDDIKRVIEQGA